MIFVTDTLWFVLCTANIFYIYCILDVSESNRLLDLPAGHYISLTRFTNRTFHQSYQIYRPDITLQIYRPDITLVLPELLAGLYISLTRFTGRI